MFCLVPSRQRVGLVLKILPTIVFIICLVCHFQYGDKFMAIVTMVTSSTPHQGFNMTSGEKVILMATPFYQQEFSLTSLGRFPSECPVKCHILPHDILETRDGLTTALNLADAVVFHLYAPDLVPGLRKLAPFRRRQPIGTLKSSQRWVLYFMETFDTMSRIKATHPPVELRRLDGLFNWTMSFRRDSDVYVPYDRFDGFEPIIETEPNENGEHFRRNKSPFKGKRHLAAVISNCRDSYGRVELLQQLAKHGLSVDIYGGCSPNGLTCYTSQSHDCYKYLEKHYLFYASFENSICADYLTEKFSNIVRYNYDMVPLVVSGASPRLAENAPPHTFIDATLFASPSDLAAFLLGLAANETEYEAYFNWRNRFRMKFDVIHQPLCALCRKLNEIKEETNDKTSKTITDMRKWLISDSQCRKNVFYEKPKFGVSFENKIEIVPIKNHG